MDPSQPVERRAQEEPTGRLAYKWVALATVALGTFMSTLDGGTINITYPALVRAFDSEPSTVLWVGIAYFLTSTSIILTLGWIADSLGRKRIYVAGFLVFSLGLALVSIAQSIVMMILFRVVQGVGSAMVLANGNAIITSAFPAQERGKAIGIQNAVVGLGLATGPLLGGVLLDFMDWRALFWTRIPIGFIGMFLALRFLREDRRALGSLRVDYLGIVLLAAAMVTFLLALNQGGRLGVSSPIVWGLAIAALTFFPMLILVEKRASWPVLDLALLRKRAFAIAQASLSLHFLAYGAQGFLVPFYLIDGLAFSPTRTGLFLTALPIVRLVASPISGVLSDRVGPRLPCAIGLLVMAGGLLLLARLGVDAPTWQLLLSLIVTGIGSAIFEPANNSSIMGTAPRDRLSMASATIVTGRQVSMSTGAVIGGAIFALREEVHRLSLSAQGVTDPALASQALVGSFGDAILVAAMISFVGAIVSPAQGKA